MKNYLNKSQAINIFKVENEKWLKEKAADKTAIRCAWNDFTDLLHKDGQITDWQVNNWLNPFDK